MIKESSNKKGKYLYAIEAGSEEHNYGPFGIDGSSVYTICEERVAAVVSDISSERIRPERRHIAAHQAVLKRIMETNTPLPMSFGVIANDHKAIKRILSGNQHAFLEQLHRVAGKIEMGLRVTWDVPNIFEYFIQTHPELKVARDRFFGTHREPTQEDKIELGRMFDRLLKDDRRTYTEKVEQILSACCFEIKTNKCGTEKEVMNLACLVEKQIQTQFEQGIFEAAKLFDNNFAFDYNGPWAPHNFADVEINL